MTWQRSLSAISNPQPRRSDCIYVELPLALIAKQTRSTCIVPRSSPSSFIFFCGRKEGCKSYPWRKKTLGWKGVIICVVMESSSGVMTHLLWLFWQVYIWGSLFFLCTATLFQLGGSFGYGYVIMIPRVRFSNLFSYCILEFLLCKSIDQWIMHSSTCKWA